MKKTAAITFLSAFILFSCIQKPQGNIFSITISVSNAPASPLFRIVITNSSGISMQSSVFNSSTINYTWPIMLEDGQYTITIYNDDDATDPNTPENGEMNTGEKYTSTTWILNGDLKNFIWTPDYTGFASAP